MKYSLLLALSLVALSCFEQGECSDVSSNVMQLNFYSAVDKKSKTILLDSITMEGSDTLMYINKSLFTIKLPLNPASDTATFHFYYATKHAVLGISYQTKTFVLAPGCNAIDLLTLLTLNPSVIQESKIGQAKLTSRAVENIKLYF